MILEDTNDLFPDNPPNDYTPADNPYTPTPKTRKQIEKILSDEKAQKGRTWEYYENLRRTEPAKYWMPKTQVQLHRDADALGKTFEPFDEAYDG